MPTEILVRSSFLVLKGKRKTAKKCSRYGGGRLLGLRRRQEGLKMLQATTQGRLTWEVMTS